MNQAPAVRIAEDLQERCQLNLIARFIEFRYSELVDMVEPIQDTVEAALLSGSAVDMDFLDSGEAGLPDEVLVSEEAHGISVIDGQIIVTWMKDESDLNGVTYILTPKDRGRRS